VINILEKFIGFSFCGIHSSKFNVYAVSNGNTYTKPLFADFVDKVESVDGFDGEYYFGTNFNSKPRTVNCFVKDVDENTLRAIQNWLNPKRIGELTFDEAPYKYYIAKISSNPEFNYMPMGDKSRHLYSGNFTIEFKAFDPFAYSYANSVDDYESLDPSWLYDSGILLDNETPPFRVENITGTTNILLYNGGNYRTKPIITINGSADELTIKNLTTDQKFTLTDLSNVEMVVDCQKGHVRVDDVLANSYHEGGFIEIEGSNRVDRYKNIEFINGSNNIYIEENKDLDIIGRFIAVNNNWYEITDFNFDTSIATLDRLFNGTLGKYDISIIDLNKINISGVNLNINNIIFDYKFRYL